jgi:hypothetical protein
MFINGTGTASSSGDQGTYINWNPDAFSGRTQFINNRGIGIGGFQFDFFNSNGLISTPLVISGDGFAGFRLPNGTTPASALDVNGSALFRSGNTASACNSNQILLGASNGGYMHSIKSRHTTTDTANNAIDFYVWRSADAFTTVGTKQIMSVTSVGVGVNTTAPAYTLDVVGDINFTGSLRQGGAFFGGGPRFFGSDLDTATNPSFTWCNDSNTGMYRPSACNIGIVTAGAERLRITNTGNIGIGTTTPTSRLHVNGSVSKTSGTFDIPHPTLSNKRLVHSFVEGPRCDLIYRGTVILSQGRAVIDLDKDCTHDPLCGMTTGTWEALCQNPAKYLHNNTSFSRVRGEIQGSKLYIYCEDTTSTDTVDWMVVAERRDACIKKWERTNTHGLLMTEYVAV